MSEAIKPIETIYNGYRFRSRLEARWAVLFDEALIDYEYEHQGYRLSDGTLYLPDFIIRDCYSPISEDLFVEVKSGEPNENEAQKARQLSLDTKTPVLIVSQIPALRVFYEGEGEFHYLDSRGVARVESLAGLDTIDKYVFNDTWLYKDGEFYGCGFYIDMWPTAISKTHHNASLELGLSIIWAGKAYRKAKQARFEHGETPSGRRRHAKPNH